MIEEVSYPADLTTWEQTKTPFYFELFGETRPVVNTKYAEVQPAGVTDAAAQAANPAPIYEYWWTIGHRGMAPHTEHLWDKIVGDAGLGDVWQSLKEPAARVYLFFPISGGWRIKELVATVKYLSPVHEQETWWGKIADDFKNLSPLVDDASKLASMVPNPAFAGASTILSTIAKLQINSVPQKDGFEWSVGKVTFGSEYGVMQGVMWTLPSKMFTELGGRLTGSLAVSFIPSQKQQGETVLTGEPEFKPLPILAHAVVYGPGEPIWAPGAREFIKLHLAPVAPQT